MSRTIRKKIIRLGKYKVEVRVKEVLVRNGYKSEKAFARIL